MKRIAAAVAVALALMNFVSPAYASSASSPSYVTTASVDGTLSLTVDLFKNSSTGAAVASMDFGSLRPLNGTLRSSTAGSTGTGSVVAMITANSHGLPYIIKQTGSAMSNGSTTLPSGACTVVPVYATQDNGGAARPAGSSLGVAGSWIATDKVLYTSESGTAAMRTIQAHYSITDDPAAGATSAVPLNQAGGSYSGTVQITVTA